MIRKELLQILQHSLGVDHYGSGAQYRNYFCAGGNDIALCRELVRAGYMIERSGCEASGGDPIFHVTESGKSLVATESPSPPKLTRGQRRYRAYLRSETGETFIEWMKNDYWDDYRKDFCEA